MPNRLASLIMNCILGLAAVSVLLWPASAAADAGDVLTLHLTGSAVCISPTTCGSKSIPATGTFQFDLDTESIVGAWSFTTPLGSSSSSDSGAHSVFSEITVGPFAGSDMLQFLDPSLPGPCGSFSHCNLTITLFLSDPQDSGTLVSGAVGFFNQTFTMSGTATPSSGSATPEPSSALLLMTGMLGLGPLLRRRFARA